LSAVVFAVAAASAVAALALFHLIRPASRSPAGDGCCRSQLPPSYWAKKV
jgi:hypothetical protein